MLSGSASHSPTPSSQSHHLTTTHSPVGGHHPLALIESSLSVIPLAIGLTGGRSTTTHTTQAPTGLRFSLPTLLRTCACVLVRFSSLGCRNLLCLPDYANATWLRESDRTGWLDRKSIWGVGQKLIKTVQTSEPEKTGQIRLDRMTRSTRPTCGWTEFSHVAFKISLFFSTVIYCGTAKATKFSHSPVHLSLCSSKREVQP